MQIEFFWDTFLKVLSSEMDRLKVFLIERPSLKREAYELQLLKRAVRLCKADHHWAAPSRRAAWPHYPARGCRMDHFQAHEISESLDPRWLLLKEISKKNPDPESAAVLGVLPSKEWADRPGQPVWSKDYTTDLVIYDLQPIKSEFPYIWRKFYFLFYQCMKPSGKRLKQQQRKNKKYFCKILSFNQGHPKRIQIPNNEKEDYNKIMHFSF